MIKFNLEKALNGAKVITRDGREVTQVTYFKDNYDDRAPLACVVDGGIRFFTKDGCYISSDDCNELDLFMASEMMSGFVNVDDGNYAEIYKTRYSAETHANAERIACIDLSQFPVGYGLEDE